MQIRYGRCRKSKGSRISRLTLRVASYGLQLLSRWAARVVNLSGSVLMMLSVLSLRLTLGRFRVEVPVTSLKDLRGGV